MKKETKEATCIRNTSTWGNLKAEYKFDSSQFNPAKLLKKVPILSPKMDALIKKIQEIDENDMQNDQKMYKHIIYSDVAGVYGAKMIASVLIANDYKLAYNNTKRIVNKSDKTFALLTTSTVYQKPLPMGLKKTLIQSMNKRPDNVFGENIRFLVIDSGFKEGIDVFDVKYVHLLEPLVTKAEQTQVIGRGTRFCGQSGLHFLPNKGWPLHVYRYNMMYDQNTNAHELYLKHCNNNISSLNFVSDIEDLLITSATDLSLTETVHTNLTNNRFFNMMSVLKNDLKKQNPVKPPERPDRIKIVDNIRGKIYTNDDKIDCKLRCVGKLEKVHTGLLIIAAVWVGKKELINPLINKFPKPVLCQYIDKIPEYCNIINMLWSSPINFFKIYGKKFHEYYDFYKRTYSIHQHNIEVIEDFINKYKDIKPKQIVYKAVPPKTKLPYLEMQDYVEKHYNPYKWEQMEIKNLCLEPNDDKNNNKSKMIEFTNTQKFVKDFMTPESPYNGMFLYHSVGSGKTCTAIATATSSFDKQGYTILWVTRHTLKQDIWKNMFDSVCNVIFQERVKKGDSIPSTKAERMKMLGNNWMQPISYKQFTNMISGKNKLYHEIVKRNGKKDPFAKTLIVIDEIHKVYSSTLSSLEKPNPTVLKNMVQNSYELAKVDKSHVPLKLLLMSATPITDDHMSVIKILNLLLNKEDEFTEDFESFRESYCMENGLFTNEGSVKFLNKTSGIVSYIDRTNDISHFAYPVIKDIMIKPEIDENNDDVKNANENLKTEELKLEQLENMNIEDFDKKDVKEHNTAIKNQKQIVKKLSKEIKKIINSKASNNIIEYINACFVKGIKKPKSLKSKGNVDNCPEGKESNEAGERCVKQKTDVKKECPEDKELNEAGTRCIKKKVPKPPLVCPEDKQLNEAGTRCIKKKVPKPPLVCPEDKQLNEAGTRCIKKKVPKPPLVCPEDKQLNEAGTRCIKKKVPKPPLVCPEDKQLNEAGTRCIKKKVPKPPLVCPEDKELNEAGTRCIKKKVPKPPLVCPEDKQLNEAGTRCIKKKVPKPPLVCPEDKQLNEAGTRCIKKKVPKPPLVCPEGKELNEAGTRCIKQKVKKQKKCLKSQIEIDGKCMNILPKNRKCPDGQIQLKGTGRCVNDPNIEHYDQDMKYIKTVDSIYNVKKPNMVQRSI
jgi:hypothetical protein